MHEQRVKEVLLLDVALPVEVHISEGLIAARGGERKFARGEH